jgi:hypothetical protein
MKPRLLASWLPALLLAAILLSACGRTTPPGPNTIFGGAANQTSYVLFDWAQGLRVLIWDNVEGGHSYHGSGSTTDPVYRQEGEVTAGEEAGYSFVLETEDGLSATFTLGGQPYDLSRGRLFVVRYLGGGQMEVQQLDRDLSGIEPTREGLEAFGRSEPAIVELAAP